MKQKQYLIYTIISLAVIITCVVSSTYAYFSASTNITAVVNVTAEATKSATFTSGSGTNVSVNISSALMASTKAVSSTATDSEIKSTGTIKAIFTGGDTTGTRCSYDIVLTRTSGSAYTPSSWYNSNKSTYKYEFTIQASIADATWYGSGSAKSLAQTNINNLTWSGNTATLISGATIQSKSTTALTQTWNIIVRFYNLPGDQNTLSSYKFGGYIGIQNVDCSLAYA